MTGLFISLRIGHKVSDNEDAILSADGIYSLKLFKIAVRSYSI